MRAPHAAASAADADADTTSTDRRPTDAAAGERGLDMVQERREGGAGVTVPLRLLAQCGMVPLSLACDSDTRRRCAALLETCGVMAVLEELPPDEPSAEEEKTRMMKQQEAEPAPAAAPAPPPPPREPLPADGDGDGDGDGGTFFDAPSPEGAAAWHKELGNAAFRRGAAADALAHYSAGLDALGDAPAGGEGGAPPGAEDSELRAALHCNRAAARLALLPAGGGAAAAGGADAATAAAAAAAVEDCSAALSLRPGYARALLRRAAARERLGGLEALEGALAGARARARVPAWPCGRVCGRSRHPSFAACAHAPRRACRLLPEQTTPPRCGWSRAARWRPPGWRTSRPRLRRDALRRAPTPPSSPAALGRSLTCAYHALRPTPPPACVRQALREKLKTEMMETLKGFGNSILGRFGMSLDHFKAVQDPATGSYSLSYDPAGGAAGAAPAAAAAPGE